MRNKFLLLIDDKWDQLEDTSHHQVRFPFPLSFHSFQQIHHLTRTISSMFDLKSIQIYISWRRKEEEILWLSKKEQLFFVLHKYLNHKVIELAMRDLMMDTIHKLFSMFDWYQLGFDDLQSKEETNIHLS